MNCVGSPVLEQPFTITSDRQTGTVIERRWLGIHAAVLGQAQIESGFADAVRFESFGAMAALTARYGAPQDGAAEILTTQIEMRGEELTQSIWKHIDFSWLAKGVQRAVQVAVDSNHTEAQCRGTISDACEIAYPEDLGLGAQQDAAFEKALDAYYLLGESTENYLVDQSYVVIRTRTASRNYNPGFEFSGDGKIWSSSQVARYIGDLSPLNIPELDALPNSENLRLCFGWRKRATDATKISNGNQQIVESWQSARWTTILYKKSTSPG